MKNKVLSILFATTAVLATAAMFPLSVHAESIANIDGNTVTLDNGDQYVVDDSSDLSVGDDVNINRVNTIGDDADSGDVTSITDGNTGDTCEAEDY